MSIILANHSRFRGMFKIERQQHYPDGSPVPGTKEVVAPWQDNLLLDSGLDNLAGGGWMNHCHLGAGSASPDPADTSLASPLGSVTGSVVNGPRTADYSSVVGSWVFAPGVATGIVAELGVGPGSGSTPLTTRSLIKDEGGSPTTITKGPIDSLTVTYQIREYPDKSDTVTTVTNPHNSQVYTVTTRTIGGTEGGRLHLWHTRGPLGGVYTPRYKARNDPMTSWDGTQYGGGSAATSDTISGYTPGSHYLDLVNTWTENAGNVGGIVSIRPDDAGNAGRIQAEFDPPIDKDNTKVLTITMRKSWGRHTP